MLSLPDPYVVLNVTAEATSNSTIRVKWKIEQILDQLIANGLKIKYCEMKRNEGNEPDGLDDRCNPCKDKNVTDKNLQTVSLTDLRSYTIYNITAQVTNISAKDGTLVETPHGNYSNPIYPETHEGGEEYVFLKVGFG